MTTLLRTLVLNNLFHKHGSQNIPALVTIRNHGKRPNQVKLRLPEWLPKPFAELGDEKITPSNQEYIQEYIEKKYAQSKVLGTIESPLKEEMIGSIPEWNPKIRRTGVIAKKIGIYPMWLKNGQKVHTTLLQIQDNHVIDYKPPDKFVPVKPGKHLNPKTKNGALIVGADSLDPQLFTEEYSASFRQSGVMPKRILRRFIISPEAALPPGTPLFASHFKPGDIVDIRSKTVDRGFQGVMKRWGFHGQPATHGNTKSHRRGGCIGSGAGRAIVIKGTKMPGHMGNRWRVIRGYEILRINTKYNVIWVKGHNIPGETNNYVYVYDTLLPLKKHVAAPYFPTYFPGISPPVPEDSYANHVHIWNDPTIEYKPES